MRRNRRSRVVGVLTLLAAAPFAWIGAPGSAGAPPPPTTGPSDEDVLDARPATTANFDTADELLVRVRITAPRLIEGRVELRRDDLVVREDVTVTAGSTVDLLLPIPGPADGSTEASVSAVLIAESEELDTDIVRFSASDDLQTVAVLPDLARITGDPPRQVTLAGELRRAELVVVGDDVLGAGAAGLSQIDVVAAASADLTVLGAAQRSALLVWIDHGGVLVVDDAGDLGPLPAQWRPAGEHVLAGAGEVHLSGGELAAGRWASAIPVVRLATTDSGFERGFSDFVVNPRLTLSQRAGVTLPDLTVIVIVLLAYVILVGPVLYLVLRRARRLTAAWVAIPLSALVVAGGIVVSGARWRSSGKQASSTVLELSPDEGFATVDALVYRRSGGTSTLPLRAGWTFGQEEIYRYWSGGATATRRLVLGEGSPRVEVGLEPGQVAVLRAAGPAPYQPLEVDARASGDGEVTGTITNRGTAQLTAVAVLSPQAAVLVGDLAAGQSAGFRLEVDRLDPNRWGSAVSEVWPDQRFAVGFRDAPGGADLGIWSGFAATAGTRLYPGGSLRVAGWVAGGASILDPAMENTTLITRVVPIEPAEGTVPSMAVRVSPIVGFWDPRTGEERDAVFRALLPAGAEADGLVVELPAGLSAPSVWESDGEWHDLEPIDGTERVHRLPPEAVIGGAVLVRVEGDRNGMFDPSVFAPIVRGEDQR